MFQSIYLPYDFSQPSYQALQWSISLASHFKAKLCLAVIQAEIFPHSSLLIEGAPFPEDKILEKVREQIGEVIAEQGGQSVEDDLAGVELEYLHEDSTQRVADRIRELKPDLVVTGTHGFTGLKHLLMGSHTEKLIELSSAPVLVVRGEPVWPFKKVLVPVDFSDYTEDSLLLATELAQTGAEKFELVHVVSLPDLNLIGTELTNYSGVDLEQDLKNHALDQFKKLVPKHPALKADTYLSTGSASREICQRAKDVGADLILMPTHGRTGLSHVFMGSTTEFVVRHAPCSVLSFCPKRERV